MKKLTTRGSDTAEAIRDLVPFTTHGALKGASVAGLGPWDSGRLSGPDHEAYREAMADIDYVVMSYATPIAWHTPAGWHKVAQKFSPTTTQHQGNLYLIDSVAASA